MFEKVVYMKKLIILFLTFFAINLSWGVDSKITHLRITSADGEIHRYDVNLIKEITFEEEQSAYKVAFYDEDSTLIESQTVKAGDDAVPPTVTPKDGYRFVGWSEDYTGIVEDKNIYASYECISCIDGYMYVDLGLSVYWASYNVGATSPEEYGDYFAWGETAPKDTYTWDNYKYCEGTANSLTKYNFNDEDGVVDEILTLLPEDDAATVNWGSNWRVPTEAEVEELRANCTFEAVTNYKSTGVNGFVITSKVTGFENVSIFMPEGGYKTTRLAFRGNAGDYWTSSVNKEGCSISIGLGLSDDGVVSWSIVERYIGRTVRAVADK